MNENQGLEKNYFIAIALSAIVLFGYFALVKPQHAPAVTAAEKIETIKAQTENTNKEATNYSAVPAEVKAAQPANVFTIESPPSRWSFLIAELQSTSFILRASPNENF